MKVKTLLKTFASVEYVLVSESGSQLEDGYIVDGAWDNYTEYEDYKVVAIKTVDGCSKLFITVK